jgi:hypothetical protein
MLLLDVCRLDNSMGGRREYGVFNLCVCDELNYTFWIESFRFVQEGRQQELREMIRTMTDTASLLPVGIHAS